MTRFKNGATMTTELMAKDDLFKQNKRAKNMQELLNSGTLFKFPSNNVIIKKYIDAKFNGGYKHLIYECNNPIKTTYKNMLVLRKIAGLVSKPFAELTEDDILDLQTRLNDNKIRNDVTKKPISREYKKDIVKCFKQFWTFYRQYAKYEEHKEVPNIVEHFRIRKDKNINAHIKFLTKPEVEKLIIYAKNLKMRALIKMFFETGARTVEILNLKKFNCSFDDKKQKWIIILPNMKGMSTQKMPIQIDYAHEEFNAWMTSKTFEDDEFIFDYTYDYVRVYFAKLGRDVLDKSVTPKLFRKSCAMYLVNLDINEQYIRGHLGWSASSDAISHYINQKALTKPMKLQNSFEKEVPSEMDELKLKLKQMEDLLHQKFGKEFGG